MYRDCQKVSIQWLFLREVFKRIAHCSYLEGFIYGFPRVIQLIYRSKEAETSKRQTLLRRGFSQDPLQFASTEVLETWSWYCMVGFTAIQRSEDLFELVFWVINVAKLFHVLFILFQHFCSLLLRCYCGPMTKNWCEYKASLKFSLSDFNIFITNVTF